MDPEFREEQRDQSAVAEDEQHLSAPEPLPAAAQHINADTEEYVDQRCAIERDRGGCTFEMNTGKQREALRDRIETERNDTGKDPHESNRHTQQRQEPAQSRLRRDRRSV